MQTQTLADPAVLAARKARLNEPHVAPLTTFAEQLNRQRPDHWTPYFDPESGGTGTEVLLLLESPGPKVSDTRMISLDNPDSTAENISCLLKLAGLNRRRVMLWNSVPWQLSETGVVTPNRQQVQAAAAATGQLLELLPSLRAVILLGSWATRGWQHPPLTSPQPFQVLTCPHPSPVNFRPRPEAAIKALEVMVRARRLCG